MFRQEILAAAQQLFVQDGYEKFSLRRLAARIGYSPTTIYIYFRDKDELLFFICEEFYGSLLQKFVELGQSTSDSLELLRKILYLYIEFGLENRELYKVVFFYQSYRLWVPEFFP